MPERNVVVMTNDGLLFTLDTLRQILLSQASTTTQRGAVASLVGAVMSSAGASNDDIEGAVRRSMAEPEQPGWTPTTTSAMSRLHKSKWRGVEEDCSVCLCSFEAGTEVVELPCHHTFHTACATEWLKRANTCPSCRAVIGEGPPVQPKKRQSAPQGAVASWSVRDLKAVLTAGGVDYSKAIEKADLVGLVNRHGLQGSVR